MLVTASFLWAVLVLFLLSNIDRVNQYKETLKQGANWASHFLPNDLIYQENTTSLISTDTVTEDFAIENIRIVIQANENTLGGLIATVNSVVVNTKERIHFYFILPEECFEHLK